MDARVYCRYSRSEILCKMFRFMMGEECCFFQEKLASYEVNDPFVHQLVAKIQSTLDDVKVWVLQGCVYVCGYSVGVYRLAFWSSSISKLLWTWWEPWQLTWSS